MFILFKYLLYATNNLAFKRRTKNWTAPRVSLVANPPLRNMANKTAFVHLFLPAGDGLIQRRELENVMTACMHENSMSFSPEQIEDLTSAIIEDSGTDSRDAITYEALKNQLEKHGGFLENLSIRYCQIMEIIIFVFLTFRRFVVA